MKLFEALHLPDTCFVRVMRELNYTENLNIRYKHTQSSSGPAPGTSTLISLDLAVVTEVSKELLLRYNWQPAVLSTEIVGAEPYNSKRKSSELRQ